MADGHDEYHSEDIKKGLRIRIGDGSYKYDEDNFYKDTLRLIEHLEVENKRMQDCLRTLLDSMLMETPNHIHRADCKEYCWIYMIEEVLKGSEQ